ncbi:MAG: hypothetical protein ABID04_03900 [Patescibacteria group bacterium]
MNLDKFMKDGQFQILALDHRGSFEQFIKINGYLGRPWQPTEIFDPIKIKAEIIEVWIDKVSALLLDVDWGLPARRVVLKKLGQAKSKPLLLQSERSGCRQTKEGRITEIEYSPSQLKELGADGVKLLLYLDNQQSAFKKQLETGKKILKESQEISLPLFLEIITYGQGSTLEIIKECLKEGLVADVFKLAYPGSPESCRQLTEILSPIPWVLLSGGTKPAVFQVQLKTAIDNGASGFMAGRGVWAI